MPSASNTILSSQMASCSQTTSSKRRRRRRVWTLERCRFLRRTSHKRSLETSSSRGTLVLDGIHRRSTDRRCYRLDTKEDRGRRSQTIHAAARRLHACRYSRVRLSSRRGPRPACPNRPRGGRHHPRDRNRRDTGGPSSWEPNHRFRHSRLWPERRKTREELTETIPRFARETGNRIGWDWHDVGRWEVTDEFVGDGYAQPDRRDFDTIQLVARLEGLFLDPVYTAAQCVDSSSC